MKKIIYKAGLLSLLIIFISSASLMAQKQKVTTTSACRLFADIENVASVLSYVPKGKELEVTEFNGDFALVEYEGSQGWIRVDKTTAPKMQQQDNYSDQQDNYMNTLNSSQDRFSILINKYGYRSGKAIYEHKIWKGADNNMVKDSWGKPANVTREVNSSGTIEIWTYRKSWLLLKNGILSEWGPNK